MENMIQSIKENKDSYGYDQIDCTEKAFGIVLDSYNIDYSSIFYMYMKLYQTYNIKESRNRQVKLNNNIYFAQDVINNNFGAYVKKCIPNDDGFFQFINKKIDIGYPVLIPGNLRGLYYSKYYNSKDHSHLFVIKGYSSKNNLYFMMDNLHIDSDIARYKNFVIEYSTLKSVNKLYVDEENKGIFYIENENIKEPIDVFLGGIDLYLTNLTKQPYKEVDFINFMLKRLKEQQSAEDKSTNKSINFQGENIDINQFISFAINAVKHKDVFFTEVVNTACKYVNDTELLNEISTLKSKLIEKWNLIINKSIKQFLLNKLFEVDKQLEEVISYEKKMQLKLKKLRELFFLSTKKENLNLDENSKEDKLEFNEVDKESKNKHSHNAYSEEKYRPPINKIQNELVNIWSEILGVENIGINDNFFYLGGDSVKAINIIVEIQKKLNIELDLTDVLKNPTIKSLGEYIQEVEQNIYSAIESAEEKEYYPLSYTQRRIYTLQQFDKNSIGYNMTNILKIEGNVNKNKIEEILKKLIERHESLRTSFAIIEEEVIQRVHDSIDFKVEYEDIQEKDIQKEVQEFIQEFDLRKAPLLRVKLAKISDNEYLLMTDIHHIIFDGVSLAILIKESMLLTQNKELPDMEIQYKDFAVWQDELFKNKKMEKQQKYWLNRLSGEINTLSIPTDYDRQLTRNSKGDEIRVELSLEVTNKLKEVSKKTSTTLHMILLSIYNILLSKYSGQEDVIVGIITSGRKNANVQNVVGMFVNTLALRNYPRKERTFLEFLEEVKRSTLEAYENQDYPFEELMQDLNFKNDPGRSPLFDTMFIMQNLDSLEIEVDGLKFKKYQLEEEEETTVDISLTAFEINKKIQLSFVYCTSLFKRNTILRLSKDFQNILLTILQNLNCKLENISILNEEEKVNMKLEIEELDDFSNIEIDF